MITSTPIATGTITVPTRAFIATNTGLSGGVLQTTAITTIALCNIGIPDLTDETVEAADVNIYMVKAGGINGTASPRNIIVSNLTIPAGETVFFSDERIILDGGDAVWIGSTGGDIDTAGTFDVDRLYVIESAGNTNFTTVGAANSTPGTVFVATGSGTGTGTARKILIVSTVSTLPV